MGVRFEVFGGVRTFSAAGAVPLRPQVARVLGILLAEPATPVSVERVVDRLWRAEPPTTATKIVHVTVGQLRRALEANGAGPSLLRTTAGGYVLEAVPHDLDEYESARARVEALRGSHPGDALIAANDAHHAWHGRPWGEDAEAQWIADRVRALEEGHRTLVETWADLLLECGRTEEAVAGIRDAVAAEPLRERRWAQLMTALYRDGRQADALAAYQRVRRLLRDELGIEPGPELRRIELAILQQDPLLLRSTPARSDVHAPTSFVGRHDELVALARAVDRDRLVTVTGIGGIGKSRLVAEFAHRESLAGTSVLRLSFSGLESTARFDDHAARQLGLFVDEGTTLAGVVAATIVDTEQLLVIDAADHVTEEVSHLALTLLERCSRLRVVATSRVVLGVGLEREFRLAPLPTGADDGTVSGTAFELMLDRAGLDPDLLDDATRRELSERCARTGGIPLLIELAARGADPGASDDAVAAIAEAIAQSLDAVEPVARTLASRAAVLPGGITESLAAGIGGLDEHEARRALRQLAWLHLVDASPGRAAVRYRSLDPVRAALLGQLGPAEREHAIQMASQALQHLVDRLWPDHTQPVHLDALDLVGDEHDNLRSVLADRLFHAPGTALELAIGASDFWALRGHVVEGRAWLEDALAAARPTGLLRARAALALVRTTRTMAETAALRDLLESATTDLRQDGDDEIILGGLVIYLAIARAWQGDRPGAARCLEEAQRLDARVGSPWTRAHIDHLRALDAALIGDFERARTGQRRFAELMLGLDDLAGAATGRYLAAMLGDMMGPAGDLTSIRADVAASRALAETVGDVSLLSRLLLLEARVLQRSHDGRSRAALAEASDRLTQHGGIAAAALARRDLGLLALEDGESAEAAATLQQVAPVLLRLHRPASAPAWAGLAVLRAADGDHHAAAVFAAAARSLGTSSAPQWAADRTRVDEILGPGPDGTAPVDDDELLALLED